MRGATNGAGSATPKLRFQSTRPVRGATLINNWHTLQIKISIHAPRAGRDVSFLVGLANYSEFQSTRPVRGATGGGLLTFDELIISIHAPRAGRDHSWVNIQLNLEISIHAPRAGRDRRHPRQAGRTGNFNPRAPCGGATRARGQRASPPTDFNPRAPCGGATRFPPLGVEMLIFQSTRPVRGRDACQRIRFFSCFNFNPRAPCGGATRHRVSDGGAAVISIHAPRAGARRRGSRRSSPARIFQSTRPVRGRDR